MARLLSRTSMAAWYQFVGSVPTVPLHSTGFSVRSHSRCVMCARSELVPPSAAGTLRPRSHPASANGRFRGPSGRVFQNVSGRTLFERTPPARSPSPPLHHASLFHLPFTESVFLGDFLTGYGVMDQRSECGRRGTKIEESWDRDIASLDRGKADFRCQRQDDSGVIPALDEERKSQKE
ncbi:hypothetical protein CONLIGDRAFT_54590 [Coniochaeta ligniaria NRRL 30616]|uniref:Uncharacterized protein n=1 Tax=Coniochaeta ligniaria NRRL 30616 TaxID=1408157 RepID=A0A1J7JPP1_9PEZI|nr:hypothetical protein CONLIGDRAFT_54590 [Coniochaeta ligniaria NRRL 30616]